MFHGKMRFIRYAFLAYRKLSRVYFVEAVDILLSTAMFHLENILQFLEILETSSEEIITEGE